MARQVYYDPFGQRTEGYRQGVADEVGVQNAVRQARQQDWNYNNVLPLALKGAQREEDFQQGFDPLRRRNAMYESAGLANKNAYDAFTNNVTMGSALGTQAPAEATARAYWSGNFGIPGVQEGITDILTRGYAGQPVGQDLYSEVIDQYGFNPMQGQQIVDSLRMLPFNPAREGGIDQFGNFAKALQLAQEQRQQYEAAQRVNFQNAGLGIQQQNADSSAQRAEASMMRAQWATQNPAAARAGWTPSTDGFFNIYTGETAPPGALPPPTAPPAQAQYPGAVVPDTYGLPPQMAPGMQGAAPGQQALPPPVYEEQYTDIPPGM